jgi:putative membrane protein
VSAVEFFPPLNASLNALSGILLLIAYRHIRATPRRIAQHRRYMLAACTSSVLFLICYVTYHSVRGGVVTKFAGRGMWRTLYLTILTSHTILAVVILPLAILSVWNGLKMRVPQHRRVARWTFPLWMYVSVTGVLVYFFLYHWFPSA